MLVALLSLGCATPMPTKHQAEVGRVAVIALPHEPDVKFDGLGAGQLVGENIGHCLAFLLTWVAPPVAAANFAACSAMVGAVAAVPPSPEEIRSAAARHRSALNAQTLQSPLPNEIQAALRASGIATREIPADRAAVAARSRDYRALSTERIDTVVETAITRVGIRGMGSRTPWGLLTDPPLLFYLHARVGLVRTADNAELVSRTYEYQRYRKHSEWIADGMDLVREIQTGHQSLGTFISEQMFLLYPLLDQNSAISAGGPLGLAFVGPASFSGFVDSLQPTLEWERFPRGIDMKWAPEEMARVKDVRYDVIVQAQYGAGASASIVYRREGLSESTHRLETPLAVTTSYVWTVRARFELDGRQRVTQWASMRGNWDRNVDAVTPPASYYHFWTTSRK